MVILKEKKIGRIIYSCMIKSYSSVGMSCGVCVGVCVCVCVCVHDKLCIFVKSALRLDLMQNP